ncbi:MAG TPA: secretin N-terminal domain-containing protein [Myxococcota bacterium]
MRNASKAFLALVAALLAAAPLPAAPGAGEPVTIYAVELQVSRRGERLNVLADGPLGAEVLEQSPEFLMLRIPNAVLDASARERLEPAAGGVVQLVTALQRGRGERREVRLLVDSTAGPTPLLSASGRSLSIEFSTADAAPPSPLDLDFGETDLESVVRAVAQGTGETYAFDEGIQGTVTIRAPQPVSEAEALALLDAVLLFKGYAAVPMPGGGHKVVPIARAPAPWQASLRDESGGEPVTTLLRLRDADAEAVLAALRPLLGAHTLAFAHAPTNSLILAGAANRIVRLRSAIEALDAAQVDRVVIWQVLHRPAEDVAEQLQATFDTDELLAVQADARNNALILRARADRVDELRKFVLRLDRPVIGAGGLHVLPVHHADPEQIANTLAALKSGGRLPSSAGESSLAGREFTVAVDQRTHALVVRSDPETASIIADLLVELDRVPAQVRIDVTVVEVSTGESLALGFDYLLPLTVPKSSSDLIAGVLGNPTGLGVGQGNLNASFTRAPLLIPIVDPLGNPITLEIPREQAALTVESREILIRELLNPTLYVASGEEHEIFAGDNVPVPVARADATNPLQVSRNVERKDVGLQLRVRPTVGQRGGVRLELELDISAVRTSLAGNVRQVGPSFTQRQLTSTIHLDEGDVAVVGFAALPRTTTRRVGVPFLHSLPLLGFLFRSTEERELDTTLIVSAQAAIVREETAALSRALRRELARVEGAGPTSDVLADP